VIPCTRQNLQCLPEQVFMYQFTVPVISFKAEVVALGRTCIVRGFLLNPMEKLRLRVVEDDILIRGRTSGKRNCMVMVDKNGQ